MKQFNTIKNRNNLIPLFLALSLIVNEIMLFLFLGLGFLPRYVWFDVCVVTICVGICVALPSYTSKTIFLWLAIGLQFILNLTNIVVVSATNEIFSFEMLFLAGEGLQAFDISFIDFPKCFMLIGVLIIEIIIFMQISKLKSKPLRYINYNLPLVLAIFMGFNALGFGGYALQKVSLTEATGTYYMFESDKYLYDNLSSKWDCLQRFGSGGLYAKNIARLITGRSLTEDMIIETAKYLASGQQTSSEVFGVSKGNNVITILLESLEWFAIDPYFTPNLYSLFYTDGITLTNFYANNRTNISEGLALVGHYPRENPINIANDNVMNVLQNEYEQFTLAQKLNAQGYKTLYVHNNVSWFYNRDKTHNKNTIGYNDLLCLENMDKLDNWVDFDSDPNNEFYNFYNWTLDSEVVANYKQEMFPLTTRFYTHFSTISSHGGYVERQNILQYYNLLTASVEEENGTYNNMWEFLTNLGYVKPKTEKMLDIFNWYKSQVMDLDNAIGIMMDYLKQNNLLNNTTILLFADHNAYYNGLSNTVKGLEYNVHEHNTKLYHIPATIYDVKLKTALENANNLFVSDNNINKLDNNIIQIDKFSTTYNLLPTMLDILGITYNPNFYLNTTIFTNENYLKIFQPNISGTPYFNNKVYISFDSVKWQTEDATIEDIESAKQDALSLYYKYIYLERLYTYPKILEKYYKLTH